MEDGPSSGRGHKVGRNRGVNGAKKLLAVAAALGVSRSMEPRIGGKRKVEPFQVAGKKKAYEGDGSAHGHAHNTYSHPTHTQPSSTTHPAHPTHAHIPNPNQSTVTRTVSGASSSRSYLDLEKQNLSSAEIKLERMQKTAQEKAEKVHYMCLYIYSKR